MLILAINASAGLARRVVGADHKLGFEPKLGGGNVELGVATNLDNGAAVMFVRGGLSVGVGGSAGVEITLAHGSIDEVLGGGAVELEGSVGPIGFNAGAGREPGPSSLFGETELGFNLGLFGSGFGGLNFTNFSLRTPVIQTGSRSISCGGSGLRSLACR